METKGGWAGVDVGGRRKGFHIAVADAERHVVLERALQAEECIGVLRSLGSRVVAIDSPSSWAMNRERSRVCERDFVATRLCGIRYTPDEATAAARTDRYLEWIELGLELWGAVRAANLEPIECFPTATWSAWLGDRGTRRRAPWTREGIARLTGAGVSGLQAARNQDDRDSVAAAFTARQWAVARSTVVRFDDLVVPNRSSLDAAALA